MDITDVNKFILSNFPDKSTFSLMSDICSKGGYPGLIAAMTMPESKKKPKNILELIQQEPDLVNLNFGRDVYEFTSRAVTGSVEGHSTFLMNTGYFRTFPEGKKVCVVVFKMKFFYANSKDEWAEILKTYTGHFVGLTEDPQAVVEGPYYTLDLESATKQTEHAFKIIDEAAQFGRKTIQFPGNGMGVLLTEANGGNYSYEETGALYSGSYYTNEQGEKKYLTFCFVISDRKIYLWNDYRNEKVVVNWPVSEDGVDKLNYAYNYFTLFYSINWNIAKFITGVRANLTFIPYVDWTNDIKEFLSTISF